jgi:thiosulfate dehydrogenase [quinone] large subunit
MIVERHHQLGVAILRIVVGIVFLWAGLEKALGAGLGTWTADGFLKFGTAGTLGWPFVTGEVAEGTVFNPTQSIWVGLAGNTLINWLVPLGQIAIGIGLVLGLFTRFSAALGTLMMLLFFFAAWDFQYGVVNQHLTYAVVTGFIGYIGAGNYYGLDATYGARMGAAFRRYLMSGSGEMSVAHT